MLDHGTLTAEDITIQVHGHALPNLGPNFHTPEVLLDAVDYYEGYQTVTAAGVQPLNAYRAHSVPKDPELHAMEREIEKAFDEIQRADPIDEDFKGDELDMDLDPD